MKNIALSSSSDARAARDIYYQWRKAHAEPGSIAPMVDIPNEGKASDGRPTLMNVPDEFLPLLRDRGLTFEVVG